jgi:hypothetical protein
MSTQERKAARVIILDMVGDDVDGASKQLVDGGERAQTVPLRPLGTTRIDQK